MALEKRFHKDGMIILWSEAALFSVVFGIAYRSGGVSAVLFAILFTFLRNPKMAIYAVFALSFLWGFIFAGIVSELGLVWAVVVGGFIFYKGVRIHLRDLKQIDLFDNGLNSDWNRNWFLGRQNLN